MAWLLVILFVVTLAVVPVTLVALAVRPSRTTVRAAAGALISLTFLVLLIVVAGAIWASS